MTGSKPLRSMLASVWLLTSISGAFAHETVVVPNVFGPEGPLVVDGNLYYVA